MKDSYTSPKTVKSPKDAPAKPRMQLQAHMQLPFYPRDAMLARVIVIATRPSVRPSVTRRYCVKTKKASGMISSPSGSPKTSFLTPNFITKF